MTVLIRKLEQLSNTSFCIFWSDGKKSLLDLEKLQESCPCARCSGGSVTRHPGVRATKIASVGNYALRIDFTEGCSRGVFTFRLLRKLHIEEES